MGIKAWRDKPNDSMRLAKKVKDVGAGFISERRRKLTGLTAWYLLGGMIDCKVNPFVVGH